MSDSLEKRTSKSIILCVLYSIVFVVLVAADQFFKYLVVSKMALYEQVVVIKNFFSFFYAQNTGSAFSLFADKPWGIYFLSVVSTVLGVAIFILMIIACRNSMKLIGFAFCLLSAGAIGNLIDRFRLKYVVDYLRFDFGSYTFPIFNFADICAVIGTILLICIIVFGSKYFESFWSLIFAKRKNENAN